MNGLEPLQALLSQTERERDEALAEHRRALDACRAADAQAEQLVVYRREYEARWQGRFVEGGRMELVNCYQGFARRLNDAVDGQARVAQQAASRLERALASLKEHEVRCASVRRLIERRVDDHRIDLQRRDQRAMDELAARSAWVRQSAGHPASP